MSGGGDFLVLRTAGTDAYNPYVYGLGKVNSAATLLLNNRAASSDPFVLSKVARMGVCVAARSFSS